MCATGFSRRSFIVLACFFTPLSPGIDGAADVAKSQQAELQNGLAEIAAKHGTKSGSERKGMARFWLTSALAALIPMRPYVSPASRNR
jgi:hypothetical protein